jgi:outer membrane protein
MNTMRTLLVLIGLFTLGISGAYAQAAAQTTNQRWSLQECIEYAFANSINVSRSNLQVQSSQAELFQSRASMLPTVNASGQQAYNFGRFVDPTTNLFIQQNTRTNNFGFNANLLLFQGLQVQNTIRAFQALFRANILDVEQAKNEVALNVALSYLDVLNNQELLEVARNVVAATELQVQRTEKLVQAGSQPQTELLTLQAQLATDKAQYVATQNNLRIARLNLMQAMNLPSTPNFEIEPIEVADPAVEPYLQSAQEVFNIALETLPSVQSADLKVKSSQHDVAAARGFYYPRLSVVA